MNPSWPQEIRDHLAERTGGVGEHAILDHDGGRWYFRRDYSGWILLSRSDEEGAEADDLTDEQRRERDAEASRRIERLYKEATSIPHQVAAPIMLDGEDADILDEGAGTLRVWVRRPVYLERLADDSDEVVFHGSALNTVHDITRYGKKSSAVIQELPSDFLEVSFGRVRKEIR